MTTPRVAVIVPCYNLGAFLEEAVDSVLSQTFSDVEIVVVDDGSTDPATRALLDRFSRPRTTLLRGPNRGLPAAKNTGIAATSAPYVCALDADDRLAPTMLARSVAVLDAEPGIAFVSHWLRTFGDEEGDWTPSSCDFPALLDVNTVNGAALVRRSVVDAVGGYDETFRDGCEDWDFWITLVERGYRGTILPEVLFHYRRRDGSMSREMLREDGHPRLYQRLVEKHLDSYRIHAAALIVRRERDIATTTAHAQVLELEYQRWLRLELAARRDDLAIAKRLTGAGGGRPDGPVLRSELDSARDEITALRSSWSWRLTAPLRRGLDLVYRIRGRA